MWSDLTIDAFLHADGSAQYHKCDVADRDSHDRIKLDGDWWYEESSGMIVLRSNTVKTEHGWRIRGDEQKEEKKYFKPKDEGAALFVCNEDGFIVEKFVWGRDRAESSTNWLKKKV